MENFHRVNCLSEQGIERYTEVTGSDGKTYYVYNEEDTSDTSYMYSLTSCGVNEELKKKSKRYSLI